MQMVDVSVPQVQPSFPKSRLQGSADQAQADKNGYSDGDDDAVVEEAIAEAKVLLDVHLAKSPAEREMSTQAYFTLRGDVRGCSIPVCSRAYLVLRGVPRQNLARDRATHFLPS